MTHDRDTAPPVARIVTTTIALMLLLALTAGLSIFDLGAAGLPAALIVSATKAVIVGLFFMDLRRSPFSLRAAAVVAVFWISLLMAGSLMDVTSRPRDRPPAQERLVNMPAVPDPAR